MNKTLNRTISTVFLTTSLIWGCASGDVPHTFQPDTPALASEVNENFDSLDNRVSGVEDQTVGINIEDYITPFSAEDDPKNVVVLRATYEDGSKRYWVRSFYANSSETVSICGTQTVKPYVANYPIIYTDAAGNVEGIYGYLESSDNESASGINIEESTYDSDGSNKQIVSDDLFQASSCSGQSLRVCVVTVTTCNEAGNYVQTYSTVKGRKTLPSFVLGSNGWDLGHVMIDAVLRDSFSWVLRIRAKDIGQIFGRHANGTERSVIYYRVNGSTRGSLAGTPFDAGQPLDGLFF